jgi:hypothetical protein
LINALVSFGGGAWGEGPGQFDPQYAARHAARHSSPVLTLSTAFPRAKIVTAMLPRLLLNYQDSGFARTSLRTLLCDSAVEDATKPVH